MNAATKPMRTREPPEVVAARPGAAIEPLKRRSLHDALVERIRDMIIEGQLAPGTRIHEGQLGQALGVSRTPLREALKFLASEGLVDLVPGRGGVVRLLTAKNVRDLLDVLTALEALAGRLACRNASEAGIAEVRRLHDEMMQYYAARNRPGYYRRNQAIHSSFAQLSDNAELASTHQSIQGRLKRIRFIGNEDPVAWASAVHEHEQMIAALEARDGSRLAEVITGHLERSFARVADRL